MGFVDALPTVSSVGFIADVGGTGAGVIGGTADDEVGLVGALPTVSDVELTADVGDTGALCDGPLSCLRVKTVAVPGGDGLSGNTGEEEETFLHRCALLEAVIGESKGSTTSALAFAFPLATVPARVVRGTVLGGT